MNRSNLRDHQRYLANKSYFEDFPKVNLRVRKSWKEAQYDYIQISGYYCTIYTKYLDNPSLLEKRYWQMYDPTTEEIKAQPELEGYKVARQEVGELVHWWRFERKIDYDQMCDLSVSRIDRQKMEIGFDKKEEEMCIRLIKIMKYLNQW